MQGVDSECRIVQKKVVKNIGIALLEMKIGKRINQENIA
jgi:hypothetical protein